MRYPGGIIEAIFSRGKNESRKRWIPAPVFTGVTFPCLRRGRLCAGMTKRRGNDKKTLVLQESINNDKRRRFFGVEPKFAIFSGTF